MEPDLLAAPSCPRCGAGLRGQVTWCTQCYLDLRPAPAPAPAPTPAPAVPSAPPAPPAAPAPQVAYGAPAPDPLTAPLSALLASVTPALAVPAQQAPAQPAPPAPERTWPCACGTANALALDACSTCGAGFLSAVKEGEAPLLAVPGLGDLNRYGRGQLAALAGGVVVALVLLVLLLGALTG